MRQRYAWQNCIPLTPTFLYSSFQLLRFLSLFVSPIFSLLLYSLYTSDFSLPVFFFTAVSCILICTSFVSIRILSLLFATFVFVLLYLSSSISLHFCLLPFPPTHSVPSPLYYFSNVFFFRFFFCCIAVLLPGCLYPLRPAACAKGKRETKGRIHFTHTTEKKEQRDLGYYTKERTLEP